MSIIITIRGEVLDLDVRAYDCEGEEVYIAHAGWAWDVVAQGPTAQEAIAAFCVMFVRESDAGTAVADWQPMSPGLFD